MKPAEPYKTLPATGLRGAALREAASGEYREIIDLVRDTLNAKSGLDKDRWVDIEAIYPDCVIEKTGGKYLKYGYSIGDDNRVVLDEPVEVARGFVPVSAMREAHGPLVAALDHDQGTRWLVRVIQTGWSGNQVHYPAQVLREAVPLFDRARVFVKGDQEHLAGAGKDVRNLIGQLANPQFVEAADGRPAGIYADLNLLQSAPGNIPALFREAFDRGMAKDLFGFSIDVIGTFQQALREGRRGRVAQTFTKVNSLDLIVEPGAGGELVNLIEAKISQPQEDTDMALREQMLIFLREAHGGNLPESLDITDDKAVLTAYREALIEADPAAKPADPPSAGLTQADLDAHTRSLEARADARQALSECDLPDTAKTRLREGLLSGTIEPAKLPQAIESEKTYIASFREAGGQVSGLGDSRLETGQSRPEKITEMLDDIFDPAKPLRSFREAYAEITGDRHVTGLYQHCDAARLREAVGEANLREAISASTFGNVLGDSITRAMIRDYSNLEAYQDFRDLVDVVPVNDFRTQERTRMGGYGNLPTVKETKSYTDLASPSDEKATYSAAKRGGVETITLETIANDDVGAISRIPRSLATAAGRTLYEFVHDFLEDNPDIYDNKKLFVAAGHKNLGTKALSATSFAAARLAMRQQTELGSAKKLGIILRHLYVPAELEEKAFDLFVRNTNNDETFVQSRKPMVHVVDYWADANDWVATADKAAVPLIELGFYGGSEEPELFVQDNPTQGSLFSHDQIKYKIRHIYGGAVKDYRGFYKAVVA